MTRWAGSISEERTAARQWLRAFIARTGTTTLLATSDRTDALALADHTVLLNAGAVEQEGTPHDLYTQPATSFAAAFMGANNRISGMLVEKAGPRAFIDVVGTRIGGVARTQAALGEPATGMIRTERVLIGGGPGTNRLAMTAASAGLSRRAVGADFREGGPHGACACLNAAATRALSRRIPTRRVVDFLNPVLATLGFPRHAGRRPHIHFFRQDDGLTGQSPAMTWPLRTEC